MESGMTFFVDGCQCSTDEFQQRQDELEVQIFLGDQVVAFSTTGPELMWFAASRGFGDALSAGLARGKAVLECLPNTDRRRLAVAQTQLQAAQQEYVQAIKNLGKREFDVASTLFQSASTPPGVMLWTDIDYSGRSLWLGQNEWVNLPAFGFNDVVSSLEVWNCQVNLYRDIDFQGGCRTFPRGAYSNLVSVGFNDVASSAVVY